MIFTKEYFKAVYNRYTCTGLSVMGICNVLLLFLYFKRLIHQMPSNTVLIAADISIVLGFSILGAAIEAVRMQINKKSRRSGSGSKERKETSRETQS